MIKYETIKYGERRKFRHLTIKLGWIKFIFYQMRKQFKIEFTISNWRI